VREPDGINVIKNALTFPKDSAFFVHTPFWRPAIDAYWWIMAQAFDVEPEPYHAANILAHGLNAVLIAWICRLFTRSLAASAAAGILFAVLPTYDFAVSWISEATDLLGLFFYLVTVLCYGLNLHRRTTGLYAFALLAFLLALLCKESASTLPVLLLGLEIVVRDPRIETSWRDAAGRLMPFAVLTALYGLLLYFGEYRNSSDLGIYSFGPHVFKNVWTYAKWMAMPFAGGGFLVDAGRAAILALALGVTGLAAWRRDLIAVLAFGWIILALLPVSFFRSGLEYRYTYGASAALAVFAGIAAGRLLTALAGWRWASPSLIAGGLAFVGLALLLGHASQGRQQWLANQSTAYAALYDQAPSACGVLPPKGHIYINGGPIFDFYGASTTMAMNLIYADIYAERIEDARLAELTTSPPVDSDCILRFRDGTYLREKPALPVPPPPP
jgi:hypothetical protein